MKSLEQIQQENRKFILEAIHGCSYEEALEKEYAKKGNNTISVPFREYEGEELTLSRVLLALLKADKPVGAILAQNKSGFYINLRSDMPWDIKFETLEEQTEKIQKGINEFFND